PTAAPAALSPALRRGSRAPPRARAGPCGPPPTPRAFRPGASPSRSLLPAFTSLDRRERRNSSHLDRDTLDVVELVEREPYLERLEACLEQAHGGSGRLVLVG